MPVTGRAELQGHSLPGPESHRGNVTTLQVFDLNHAVRILALDEPRGLHRAVLSVAITARRAAYSKFEPSCGGCGNGPSCMVPESYSRQVSASRAILSHSSAILPQCSFSISVLHRSACRRQSSARSRYSCALDVRFTCSLIRSASLPKRQCSQWFRVHFAGCWPASPCASIGSILIRLLNVSSPALAPRDLPATGQHPWR